MVLPDSEHNENLAPDTLSGALFNYQWRKIVVGILERELPKFIPNGLTEIEQQEYETRIDNLIEDIYTVEDTSMSVQYRNAYRTSNQAIVINTDTAVIWQQGNYEVSNPTRIKMTGAGLAIVTANVQFSSSPNTNSSTAWIRRSGLDDFSLTGIAGQTTPRYVLAQAIDYVPDDYFELFVRTNVAGSVLTAVFLPRLNIIFFPN